MTLVELDEWSGITPIVRSRIISVPASYPQGRVAGEYAPKRVPCSPVRHAAIWVCFSRDQSAPLFSRAQMLALTQVKLRRDAGKFPTLSRFSHMRLCCPSHADVRAPVTLWSDFAVWW